eukprot:bmy_20543T0
MDLRRREGRPVLLEPSARQQPAASTHAARETGPGCSPCLGLFSEASTVSCPLLAGGRPLPTLDIKPPEGRSSKNKDPPREEERERKKKKHKKRSRTRSRSPKYHSSSKSRSRSHSKAKHCLPSAYRTARRSRIDLHILYTSEFVIEKSLVLEISLLLLRKHSDYRKTKSVFKRSVGAMALIEQSFFRGSSTAQASTCHSECEVCASVPQTHGLPGMLSSEACQGSSAVAAAQQGSYRAASTTNRFDSWSSFEGKPGKLWKQKSQPLYKLKSSCVRGAPEPRHAFLPEQVIPWLRSRSRSPRRRAHSPERRREDRSVPTAYRMSNSPGVSRKRTRSRSPHEKKKKRRSRSRTKSKAGSQPASPSKQAARRHSASISPVESRGSSQERSR